MLIGYELPRLSLKDMASFVRDFCIRRGGTKGDRVQVLCEVVIASPPGSVPPSDPRFPLLVQAMKDVQELWFAITVLSSRLDVAPWDRLLRRCFDDGPIVTDEGESKGRDAQFELYLSAIADRSGLAPELNTGPGPDFRVRSPVAKCAVEVKRIKSWRQIPNRVRKAASQIQECGLGGLIVCDISVAVGLDQHMVPAGATDEALRDAQYRRQSAFATRLLPKLVHRVGTAPVGGIVLHDYFHRPSIDGPDQKQPWSLTGTWDYFPLFASDSPLRQQFASVWEALSAGLPDL